MDVSAEEYLNWGRTRLRVELKKRGLSPSGLKTELLARLEEYFKRQKASGGGAGHHLTLNNHHNHHGSYSNNNNNRHTHGHGHQRSTPSSSSSSAPAGGHSQPLLPKQHHSKQLLDLFHHQLQQQQQSEAAALGRELPRKRSRKSQTPRRGLQPQGGSDNTSSEGEGSDHTSGGGSPHSSTSSPSLGSSGGYGSGSAYGSDVIHQTNNSYNHLGNDYPSHYPHKKPRLGQRYSQMTHESDDNGSGNGSGGSGGAVPDGEQQQQSSGGKAVTPLSGRVFKKESGLVQASHAEVRSVETIVFGPGDQFHFTHRFWRGKLLRRRFDFYGTYTIVPVAGAPVDGGGGAAGGRAAAAAGSADLQLDDLVALSCALAAAARAGEKDGAAMAKADENRLRERTEGKVILHWPSKLDAPELRDWQFDQSYSHLFLAATAAPSSSSSTAGGATAGSGGLGSSSDATQPGSTSPVVQGSSASSSGPQARKRPHFLYTKHSAVFVEDTC